MSAREFYSTTGKPLRVAEKALEIIRRNKPKGANLTVFEIVEEAGGTVAAIGRSEGGIFHDSQIEVAVWSEGGVTRVEVEANDDKFTKLLVKLRKKL